MKCLLLLASSALLLQLACGDNLPNIVILFADDLGWGDLTVYGHPTSTTPNLDKMASEGLVFKQFYSASSLCSPSRAALLTGRYQARTGVYPGVFHTNSIGGLPLNETTIAEGLKTKGYSTAIVGKWHLGVGKNKEYLPIHQGFDSYYGIPYSQDMCPCPTCFYPDAPCFSRDTCEKTMVSCPVFSDDVIVQQPADFTTLTSTYVTKATDAIKKATDKSSPFFLYMAFQHTHRPQFAGEEWTNSSIRGPFGDALNELDWTVGEIFQALKDNKVDDNTLVFFTADNGPSLVREIRGGNAGPLRCGKASTWEGGMREPAIAWWPGKISPGVTRELAGTIDIFPTLMKLVGVNPPSNVTIDGVDMSQILFENKPSNRESFMYYSAFPSKDDGLFAVRWKQYKAHFIVKGGACDRTYPDMMCRSNFTQRTLDSPLLYDLHHDPGEIYPLDTKKNPTYADILKQITKMKTDFDADMVWGDSQIDGRGVSNDAEPCAKPGCSPFPTCCSTAASHSVWDEKH